MGPALELAFRHPTCHSTQQLACTLCKLCKDSRTAVLDGETATLDAFVRPGNIGGIVSFTSWLSRHARIVRSISIRDDSVDDGLHEVAEHILSQSMQLAGERLRLAKYSSSIYCGSRVLTALPAANLTALELDGLVRTDVSALAPALQRLPRLHALQLKAATGPIMVDSCMPAIGQLSKLTRLVLWQVGNFDSQVLPVQLQVLRLGYWLESDYDFDTPVDASLGHLTRLRFLSVDLCHDRVDGVDLVFSRLPVQLKQLKVSLGYDRSLAAAGVDLTAATQLEKIKIKHSSDTAQDLLDLGGLPALWKVELAYQNLSSDMIRAAAAWPQLRMLHSIELCDEDECQSAELRHVVSQLSEASNLTCLSLNCCVAHSGRGPVMSCDSISRLLGLRVLSLNLTTTASRVLGDPRRLTSLSNLTKLTLEPARQLLTVADVVVLMRHAGTCNLTVSE